MPVKNVLWMKPDFFHEDNVSGTKMLERPNQVLKLINAHITTTIIVMTQHD